MPGPSGITLNDPFHQTPGSLLCPTFGVPDPVTPCGEAHLLRSGQGEGGRVPPGWGWTPDSLSFLFSRWTGGYGHCWRHGPGRGRISWTHRICCIQVQILNETVPLPLPRDTWEPLQDTWRGAHPFLLSLSFPIPHLCPLWPQPPLP